MAQSIKLQDDLMELARTESDLQSRSLAGQISHWARIGRAIEQSAHFDYRNIRSTLAGEQAPEQLSLEERKVWLDAFSDIVGEPTDTEKQFFAARQSQGLGVGLSGNGKIMKSRNAK